MCIVSVKYLDSDFQQLLLRLLVSAAVLPTLFLSSDIFPGGTWRNLSDTKQGAASVLSFSENTLSNDVCQSPMDASTESFTSFEHC